jgi:hypothetical protein
MGLGGKRYGGLRLKSCIPLNHVKYCLLKEYHEWLCQKRIPLPAFLRYNNCAVIAENEMVGDFNIKISGMTLDFQGKLMRTKDSVQFPLTRKPPVPKTNMEEVKS